MSTYSIVAYVTFFGLNASASFATRASGTRAIPRCICAGALRVSTFARVKIRNKLVFPTCGSPMIPVCIIKSTCRRTYFQNGAQPPV